MRPQGVAYGPADNGSVATYVVLDREGPERFRVCRVAVAPRGGALTMAQVRALRPTGGHIRSMDLGPGGLESVMWYPEQSTREGAHWPRRLPVPSLPDASHTRPSTDGSSPLDHQGPLPRRPR